MKIQFLKTYNTDDFVIERGDVKEALEFRSPTGYEFWVLHWDKSGNYKPVHIPRNVGNEEIVDYWEDPFKEKNPKLRPNSDLQEFLHRAKKISLEFE